MPEAENADTESQRIALEEMSQQLLERLNAMVAEQEKRAAEFAARTHSLSALPEVVPPPQVPVVPELVAPPATALPPVPPLQAERRVAAPPSAARSVPPPPAAKPKAEPAPQQQWTPAPKKSLPGAPRGQQQGEQSSIGFGWVAFVMFVIYFLIRACSN